MSAHDKIAKLVAASTNMLRAWDRFAMNGDDSLVDEFADELQDAIDAVTCPGCREYLDGKLVCPCNPELEVTHGRDDETHS